jgi:hypothetical protein
MRLINKILVVLAAFALPSLVYAQEDTTSTDEEDYSMYGDFGYADEGSVEFANAKVIGISPARFISVGYDYQGAYDIDAASMLNETYAAQTGSVLSTQGVRLAANVPVLSKNSILIQLGGQYWNMNYNFDNAESLTNPLLQTLSENGLSTIGLNTTIYKPFNGETFMLAQLNGDMNGDFAFGDFQPMNYNRYSVAVLLGKRPSDYKQWAFGLSRTYRAGELNYVPIFMYNYTSKNEKWGVEALLPARGHVRYKFSARSLLMFGFELEGNSYRIGNAENSILQNEDLEIRRSEIRARFMYQKQLTGFIWVAAELGYRINYSYNVDQLPDGQDFLRLFGIVDDSPNYMVNNIGNPLYFNLSLNLVSP